MNDNPLPSEDQQVTLISVRDGNIAVTSARALVVKPRKIALRLETGMAEASGWTDEQALTLIYTHGERVMRLRAVLREHIDESGITVEPVGEVKEGDRRDYRRADVDAQLYIKVLEVANAAEARSVQLATEVDDAEYQRTSVNLSGSGLGFCSTDAFTGGQILDIRILLKEPTPARLSMIGDVVRVIHREGQEPIVAVRFAELSEADQDIIVYTVFSNHFSSDDLASALDLDD